MWSSSMSTTRGGSSCRLRERARPSRSLPRLQNGGIADVYFDGESPEILFSVHASSLAVTRLIYELARELEMFVFFPLRDGWGAAVVEETARQELPDRVWSGWQDFDEDFDPPEPVVCRNAADLDAALAGSYREGAEWAHGPGWA
jgi:hypothetical protein